MSPELLVTKPNCCKSSCIKTLSLAQIKQARLTFNRNCGSHEKQRQYILDWLDSNQSTEREFVFSISGITVCQTCWINVLGITRRKFFLLKKDYLNKRRSGGHANAGSSRLSWKSEVALNFMSTYFKELCDYLPTANIMHLPSNIRKSDVFDEMKLTLESQGQSCCTKATFINLWKDHFSNVKIPKVNCYCSLSLCNITKTHERLYLLFFIYRRTDLANVIRAVR
jgi:hypothetical protein